MKAGPAKKRELCWFPAGGTSADAVHTDRRK